MTIIELLAVGVGLFGVVLFTALAIVIGWRTLCLTTGIGKGEQL